MEQEPINITHDPQRKGEGDRDTSSLVLGVLSIVCAVIGFLPVGLVLGIIGIVHGSKARGKAGFVCSIIGTVLSSLVLFVVLALLGVAMGWFWFTPLWW